MESYSIMMVDDERFVVDWLYELLEVRFHGQHTLYRAYNSKRALEIIERTRIDLVITDINMPGMNGLELIGQATRFWPMCKCILLTGHSDFDYAKTAINKGAVGYILKTAGDDVIVAEVEKALLMIEESINSRSLLVSMQKDLDDHISQLKRQAFFTWVRGNHQNESELESYREILGFAQKGVYYMMMGEAFAEDERGKGHYLADSIPYFRIKSIVGRYIAPYIEHCVAELANTRIIWILRPNQASQPHFERILMGVLDLVQRSCRETVGMRISFVLGETHSDPVDLPEQYSALNNCLNSLPREGDIIRLCERSSVPENADSLFTPYRFNVSTILLKFLTNGERQDYFTTLHAACDKIAQSPNWYNSLTVHLYFSILQAITAYLNLNGLSDTSLARGFVQGLYAPAQAQSFSELREKLFAVSETLFTMREENSRNGAESIMDTVREYIRVHIAEDILLIDLSELTGYSTSYLSRLFSKTTSMTVSAYIAEQKVAHIKRLMENKALSISEIAQKAGFHSRAYFNSYFKRNVGVAPQTYRDQSFIKD